eukprot:PhM_4_TR5421/c0_g1_i1/m.69569
MPELTERFITDSDGNRRYERVRKVGEGVHGDAFLVTRPGTTEEYVAKVINVEACSTEIVHLAQCHHPNIVSFVESFNTKEGAPCVVTELANRGDLSQQVKFRKEQNQPFQENEIILMFIQLALAIDYMHSRRMLHRDIKSGNILLFHTGLVKLGDFGLSRQYDESVSMDVALTYCGTPEYLAPEIWARHRYGKKADVWALGIVLYELATFNVPFAARSMEELAMSVQMGTFVPLPTSFSSEFTSVVTSLLAPSPAERPSIHGVFTVPKWNEGLRMFVHLMAGHNELPADAKEQLLFQCLDILSEVSRVPEGVMAPVPPQGLQCPIRIGKQSRESTSRHAPMFDVLYADLSFPKFVVLACPKSGRSRRILLSNIRAVTQQEGGVLVLDIDGCGELTIKVENVDEWLAKIGGKVHSDNQSQS